MYPGKHHCPTLFLPLHQSPLNLISILSFTLCNLGHCTLHCQKLKVTRNVKSVFSETASEFTLQRAACVDRLCFGAAVVLLQLLWPPPHHCCRRRRHPTKAKRIQCGPPGPTGAHLHTALRRTQTHTNCQIPTIPWPARPGPARPGPTWPGVSAF